MPHRFSQSRLQTLHELLLRAAVHPDRRALDAWTQWRESADIDSVDPVSYGLLPRVYRNLAAQGVTGVSMDKLKGVYRYTWSRNQRVLRVGTQVLSRLQEQGIDAMPLERLAMLARGYCRDEGLQILQRVAAMVRETSFRAASEILVGAGWEPIAGSRAVAVCRDPGFRHRCVFRGGEVEVELRAGLLRFMPRSVDRRVWREAAVVDWRGLAVAVPSPTDLLFHGCVAGVQWYPGFVSWVPDAVAILRGNDPAVDWDLLLTTARQTRTELYLLDALEELVDRFEAPVPAAVLAALAAAPSSWVERREYRIHTRNGRSGWLMALQRVLWQSCRHRAVRTGHRGPIPLYVTAWMGFFRQHLGL